MSRFFSDLEEEKKEIRKSVCATRKPQEKLSKKDKLTIELDNRIQELNKNMKNIKKFLADLRKYDSLGVPDNLKEFLMSAKVYTKGNKKVIDEYMHRNTSLDDVVTDDIQEYDTSVDATDNDQTSCSDMINTVIRHTKDRNVKGLYNAINMLVDNIDNKALTFIRPNLPLYFDLFYSDREYFVCSGKYLDCLKKVRNIDSVFYGRRVLDLYYKDEDRKIKDECKELVDNVYNNYDGVHLADYKLLDAVINNDLEECVSVLGSFVFSNVVDNLFIDNISRTGQYLFTNRMYSEAFTCYAFVYDKNKDSSVKTDLLILCVVLNHKIKEHKIYKEFLSNLLLVKSNVFLFECSDCVLEICRGFCLLHQYDVDGCYRILNKIQPAFVDKCVLYEIVNGL